jgi:hypothetical protein
MNYPIDADRAGRGFRTTEESATFAPHNSSAFDASPSFAIVIEIR